ncbi:MAG: radical SAM protein [Chloroflexi bacterium]|nr:radical SAM protein [Chloroflexota bacterium]MDA1297115.1 radical SAM protein [Chloroflexota bacterium]
MLSVTRLLCDSPTPGDDLRYGEHRNGQRRTKSVHHRPVVVWNITRQCNLHCAHCYSSSHNKQYAGELSLAEGKRLIEDLAEFGAPVLLFSGGEPLMREVLPELIAHARKSGIKPVLSTNGTLLNRDNVARLADAGLDRVGISLDGLRQTNDKFRGSKGAFDDALSGIRNATAAGMTVSVRFTMTSRNVADLPGIFDLAVEEGAPRLCVYHLAYAGRGAKLLPFDLDNDSRRKTVEDIFERTIEANSNGRSLEVLTVDNHVDGPYMLLWSRENAPGRTGEIERLLKRNGGNSTGTGIACVDNTGNVHPDQFWWARTLGNVRKQPFSEIWSATDNEFLNALRNRKSLLGDPCKSCRWLDICNGNLRVRAESATGDPWGFDPACYLTLEERA